MHRTPEEKEKHARHPVGRRDPERSLLSTKSYGLDSGLQRAGMTTLVAVSLKALLVFFLLCAPSLSQAVGDPFKKMAKDLLKGIKKVEKTRLGLLIFPYHDGRVSSGSSIVSERLTTQLATTTGVRVVERSLIKKVLEEQHMMETGIVDPITAKELGKILGVDVIVTGTLIDLQKNQTEVNARALKADTGEVLSASRAIIERSWPDRPRAEKPSKPFPPSYVEGEEPSSAKNEAIEIGLPAARGRGGFYRR